MKKDDYIVHVGVLHSGKMTDAWKEICVSHNMPVNSILRITEVTYDKMLITDKLPHIPLNELFFIGISQQYINNENDSITFPQSCVHGVHEPSFDPVKRPSHYDLFGENTMGLIASTMTEEQFKGFCLGNVLKYRLRAGKKGNMEEDLAKATNYEALFDTHKNRCRKE